MFHFSIFHQSWEESVLDRYREKLLELIGKIGRDDRQGKTASKILDLLWTLAHLPQLSREMVELALESHSTILIDSYHTKEAEKKSYINKCVEDIKKVSEDGGMLSIVATSCACTCGVGISELLLFSSKNNFTNE